MRGIKSFLLFLFLPFLSSAQQIHVKLDSSFGLILMNEKYIHGENLPVQRIDLIRINEKTDIFAWKWVGAINQFYFNSFQDKMWFLRLDKSGKLLNRYKIYNYKYEIKE